MGLFYTTDVVTVLDDLSETELIADTDDHQWDPRGSPPPVKKRLLMEGVDMGNMTYIEYQKAVDQMLIKIASETLPYCSIQIDCGTDYTEDDGPIIHVRMQGELLVSFYALDNQIVFLGHHHQRVLLEDPNMIYEFKTLLKQLLAEGVKRHGTRRSQVFRLEQSGCSC